MMAVVPFEHAEQCPKCGAETVRVPQGVPWCPGCGWNLSAYERGPSALGWGWFERLSYRFAFRLDRNQFERFRTELPDRPGVTKSLIALVALSGLVLLGGLVSLVIGVWLIVDGFPSWWGLLGLVFLGFAALVRPRFGKLPEPKTRLRREQAPSLFALVERVAEHVGTPPPDIIVLDQSFNASVSQRGWRRQSVLWLGAPLWLTLDPGMRVAVLAHELGHLVNADPLRRQLLAPLLNVFRVLAEGFAHHRTIGQILDPDQRQPNIVVGLMKLLMWGIARVCFFAHLAVVSLASRDHQAAEYFADRVSSEVAGTEAALAAMHQILLAEQILTSVDYSADRFGPDRWQQLARAQRVAAAEQLRWHEQHSQRETDLWRSHPPTGFRSRLIEHWPHREAALVLTQAASDHLDRDLGWWATGAHRRLLGTRVFRPLPERAPQPSRPARTVPVVEAS